MFVSILRIEYFSPPPTAHRSKLQGVCKYTCWCVTVATMALLVNMEHET